MATLDVLTPPDELLSDPQARFVPSHDLKDWMVETFIEEGGELFNERYAEHNLNLATIGVLWANTECRSKGRYIAGRCSLGEPRGGDAWKRGKKEQQVREWFGKVPDFIITLDGHYVSESSHPSILALIEHELHHCGQKRDKHGMPAFNQRTGKPKWTVLGHDVEEFIGVVRRYGAEATGTQEFVNAAMEGPTVGRADIDRACGTCLKQVA